MNNFEENKQNSSIEAKTKAEPMAVKQTGTLKERLSRIQRSRWIRFATVSVIFFGWVAWLGSWWVLVFWFLLFDIYITKFIPWNWWKFSPNPIVRKVMSWVDAIVYALVLVYFLFLFVGQNYQIPSSSLEKTLLTGDFLWVNKMVYGPRVPQTPLHFPLAQNTLPGGFDSYIESPQWAYHRLKGYRGVERGDIVVFNFPAGDTVATKVPNPDYYSLCYEVGRAAVWANSDRFGKVKYRPVDRRDAYVKRCIGLPGETLTMKNGTVYINGKPLPEPQNMQRNYIIETDGTPLPVDLLDELKISNEARSLGNGQSPYGKELWYAMPLTKDAKKAIEAQPYVKQVRTLTIAESNPMDSVLTYPLGVQKSWTHNDYGPLWIPKKGATLKLSLQNLPYYIRCIKNYEGNSVEVKGNTIFINGKPATHYTFKMDYYWMMGDNRDNSSDSRYWGFVPEDHIIGQPMFVIISFDPDKPLLQSIRWDRIFKSANPDK